MNAAADPGTVTANPPVRVVLLGASNLTRGISTVVESARRRFGGPVEVLAALGHGRSYGMTSQVLARSITGILDCGLWDALHHRPPAGTTCALLTDIGNDIMYGADPDLIAAWIEECLDRLAAAGAHTIVTRLPTGSIEDLGRARFAIARAVIYPARRLTLADARARAREVDELVRAIAEPRGVHLAEQRREWYGFDPVHIRMRAWPTAWREILSAWPRGDGEGGPARPSLPRWIRLRTSMPQSYRMFGRPCARRQPATRLPDGTTVSLY